MRVDQVWMNGALIAAAQASVPVSDRGFALGDGVFETMAVQDGTVCHLARHLARLRHGLSVIGLDLAHDDQDLTQAIGQVVVANGLDQGIVRLTVSRGQGPRGLLPPDHPQPVVLIVTAPSPPALGPLRLITATVTRRNQHSPLSRIKSLNYLDMILARQQAQQAGAGDALLLNGVGRVCETTIANLIVDLDGTLVTPPVEDGVLPGVRRSLLLEKGLLSERSLLPADLGRARALVAVNSLSIRPVIAVDDLDLEAGLGHSLADLVTRSV